MCSLMKREKIKYIMAWLLCSFVCALHYHIIIIMHIYVKALNFWNACTFCPMFV